MRDLKTSIEIVKHSWVKSPYYESAERWTPIFWDESSRFRRCFEQLDIRHCAELACGHGRHSEQLLRRYGEECESLYCLDVVPENVHVTAARLKEFPQVTAMLVEGKDFFPIPDGLLTAVFCYDAMVHFSADIVESYLRDAPRVLRPGGRLLLHHSNLDAPDTGTAGRPYGTNPHARNHMTFSIFSKLASDAGLKIIDSEEFDWGGARNIDRLTLLEYP